VKRGEYGSVLFTRTFSFWSPAFPFDEVIDPTGAGDSFAGGFPRPSRGVGLRWTTVPCVARRFTGPCAPRSPVESFSVDGIEAATPADVAARYRVLQDLVKV
jgi:hypothetical protein